MVRKSKRKIVRDKISPDIILESLEQYGVTASGPQNPKGRRGPGIIPTRSRSLLNYEF